MPTRPPGTPDVDLTFDGASGTINGGVFMTGQFQLVPDQFFSFLEIRHNGEEEGYNTDGPLQQDQRDVQNATHSIILAEIPIVIGDGSNGTIEGVAYREFRLNIGEAGNAKQYLSLDELQIWQGASGSTTNFTGGYLAYDLDAGADRWIGLKEGANGNGADQTEFTILIPDSYFINDPAHRYVTLYSQFGMQDGWEADSSSEVWGLSVNSAGLTPAMTVHKTATVPGGTANAVGEVISYAITVANVGEVNLTGITVTDPTVSNLAAVLSGGFNVGDTNQDNILSTGETWQYSASYTVTQNDLDTNGGGDGLITNDLTADSAQTAPISASASIEVETGNSIDLEKTADVTSVGAAGDAINYTIMVTNDGTVTQGGLQVDDTQVTIVTPIYDPLAPVLGTDPLVGPVLDGDYNAGDTDQDGIEDPGETFQYQIIGDENGNGAQDPGETFIFTNVGDTNQNGEQDPGETFQYYNAGDTNQNGVEDSGETFEFNVSHAATPVTSGGFNVGDTDMDGQFDVGETWQYTVSYTVTQDDIDNGGVVNPALTHDNTASATTAQGASDEDTASVSVVQDPRVSIVKSASVADGTADEVGDVINYTINVSNAGNMTLTDIDVSDPSVDLLAYVSGDTDGDNKLDLTETWVYTASHEITQADIDNGGVVDPGLTYDNTATVTTAQSEQDPDGDPDATASDTASVAIVQDPRVSLSKSATVADGTADEDGDVINYTINVANAGNMTLTGAVVSDPSVSSLTRIADVVGNNDNILDVGETWQYTASHTVTQADIDNGGVVDPGLTYDNTASVTTDQGADDADANDSDSESVPIVQDPRVSLSKSATVADGTADEDGDVINYTINVANAGNMTLTGAVVSDPSVSSLTRIADVVGNNDNILDAGETWQYTASHTVTQADIDNGGVFDPGLSYDNTASVTTDQGADDADANDSDSESVPIVQSPSIAVDKTATVPGDTADTVGEVISYAISVTNDGNMTLTGVSVSDPSVGDLTRIADLVGNNDNILNLGETWQYTASHTVTQADLDTNGGGDGTIDNTASVTTGQGASDSDSASVTVEAGTPSFTFEVNALGYHDNNNNNVADNGDVVDFSVDVHNTGTATLTNIAIVGQDGLITYSGIPIASLGPGLTDSTVTGTHLIQGGTGIDETQIGQSDQVGNVLFEVTLNYNTLLPL